MCVRVQPRSIVYPDEFVQVEVTVNTRPGNKSKTTFSLMSVLYFIDAVNIQFEFYSG